MQSQWDIRNIGILVFVVLVAACVLVKHTPRERESVVSVVRQKLGVCVCVLDILFCRLKNQKMLYIQYVCVVHHTRGIHVHVHVVDVVDGWL